MKDYDLIIFDCDGTSHNKEMSESWLIEAGATQIFDDFIHMGKVLKL